MPNQNFEARNPLAQPNFFHSINSCGIPDTNKEKNLMMLDAYQRYLEQNKPYYLAGDYKKLVAVLKKASKFKNCQPISVKSYIVDSMSKILSQTNNMDNELSRLFESILNKKFPLASEKASDEGMEEINIPIFAKL